MWCADNPFLLSELPSTDQYHVSYLTYNPSCVLFAYDPHQNINSSICLKIPLVEKIHLHLQLSVFVNDYRACTLKFNYQKKACHIPINHGVGDVLTWRTDTEPVSAQGQNGQCAQSGHSLLPFSFLLELYQTTNERLSRSFVTIAHFGNMHFVQIQEQAHQVTEIKSMPAGKSTAVEHSAIKYSTKGAHHLHRIL